MKVIGVTGAKHENNKNQHISANKLNLCQYRIDFNDWPKKVNLNNEICIIYLPIDKDNIKHYIKLCDGIIFTGGDGCIPQNIYNKKEEEIPECPLDKSGRIEYEITLFNEYQKTEKPILGICLGAQIINVARGGDLIYCYSKKHPEIKHFNTEQDKLFTITHSATIKKKSVAHNIFKKDKFLVNSEHYDIIGKLGKGLVASGFETINKTIEVIEDPNHPFILGMQWHPEMLNSEESVRLFKAFFLAT